LKIRKNLAAFRPERPRCDSPGRRLATASRRPGLAAPARNQKLGKSALPTAIDRRAQPFATKPRNNGTKLPDFCTSSRHVRSASTGIFCFADEQNPTHYEAVLISSCDWIVR
jgi:hypothetical protein